MRLTRAEAPLYLRGRGNIEAIATAKQRICTTASARTKAMTDTRKIAKARQGKGNSEIQGFFATLRMTK
jgi:hypothetical protein